MNGDGLLVVICIIAGGAALALYGIPALVLILSKRTNRVAARISLSWSILPAGIFVVLRSVAKEDFQRQMGDHASEASILLLLPTALIAWRAWVRIDAPDVEEAIAVQAQTPPLAGPGRNFIGLWIGAYALDRVLWSAAFALLIPGQGGSMRVFFVLSALSWVLLSSLQWLILKDTGVAKSWIFATIGVAIAVQILLELFDSFLRIPNRLAGAAIYSLIYSVPIAAAQWACLSARLEKRWLWLLALPGAELCAAMLVAAINAQSGPLSSPTKELLHLVAGVLVGASTGAAMKHILTMRSQEPK